MLTVSRRGFLALGGTGAAGVALSACGTVADQRDNASPSELNTAQTNAETALAAAYSQAASALPKGEERTALESFAAAAAKRTDALGGATAQAGDTPPPDGGPDSPEALDGAIHAANAAIAAHRQAAGLLDTTEDRAQASSFLVACAAELAAVNGFAGKDEVPFAFVTGGPEKPYESTDSPAGSESTSTTSSSTASSSTTTGDEQ